MKDLITTDNQGHIFVTSKILADEFNPISKFNHRDILRLTLSMLWDLDFYPQSRLVIRPTEITKPERKDIIKVYFNDGIPREFTEPTSNAWFNLTTYKSRGKNYNIIQMNRQGFMLATMQLGRYKNALRVQLEFIKAFDLLEQHFQNTKALTALDEQEILENIIPFDKHGTASKVNGKPREKLVKSYYSSRNGKAIDKNLVERIEFTQLNLFGEPETYKQPLRWKK